MTKLSIPLTLSISLVMFIAGITIGYYLTPNYQQDMYSKNAMELGAADRWLDLRYINAMIAHHRRAVIMAEQAAESGQRDEIKQLAGDILEGEPALIAKLYDLKKELYRDTKPVKDPEEVNLGPSDENFDLRFLNSLIFHHEEGIQMTAEARTKTSTAAVLDDANAVEDFLRTTLIQFRQWRNDWYGV